MSEHDADHVRPAFWKQRVGCDGLHSELSPRTGALGRRTSGLGKGWSNTELAAMHEPDTDAATSSSGNPDSPKMGIQIRRMNRRRWQTAKEHLRSIEFLALKQSRRAGPVYRLCQPRRHRLLGGPRKPGRERRVRMNATSCGSSCIRRLPACDRSVVTRIRPQRGNEARLVP